jgi:hypothetical protein
MAIAGSWLNGAVTPVEYEGALKWGTGINPIHFVPDNGPGRGPTKEPLGSTGPSDAVDASLTDPSLYGFEGEDAQYYAGEDYRYLEDDHPNWGDGTTGRADRDGQIMAPGVQPDPTGFPAWGPHHDDNPADGFPVGGPPGGAALRAQAEGTDVERLRAIAVPTQGYRGGWLNKAHGQVDPAQDADPSQLQVATSGVQLHQTRVNTAATARGTDDPRAPIETRLTGQKIRSWAKSSGMGGGPGTPDMAPVTQDLPYRPWFFRSAAVPPPPDTTYGTMTGFEPLERVPPVDAGELVTTTETGAEITSGDVADQDYYQ